MVRVKETDRILPGYGFHSTTDTYTYVTYMDYPKFDR